MILPPRHTLEQVYGSNWIHRALLVCGTHTEEEARVEDLHTCLLQDAPGECQQNTDSLGDEVNKMTSLFHPQHFTDSVLFYVLRQEYGERKRHVTPIWEIIFRFSFSWIFPESCHFMRTFSKGWKPIIKVWLGNSSTLFLTERQSTINLK